MLDTQEPEMITRADRSLPRKAQRTLDEALDALMARQVCDAALDGALDCELPRPCAFHAELDARERQPEDER